MKYKKIFAIFLCMMVALVLGSPSDQEEIDNRDPGEEVKIPMILTIDSSTGNKNEEDVITAFNEEYEGKYQVDAQWVLQTEEEYRTNLKRLNVTDELPAIITDLRLLPSFYQLMIHDERIEDLSSAIEEDEEWKKMIEPAVLEACTEADGSIYLAPLSTAFYSCSGVFWNEQLFQQAGIEKFPETWEEFWKCCEKLQSKGIIPLALHTEGTAWAPMLLATAELADSKEGAQFMEVLYPDSYQNRNGLQLADTLKKLFQYTTENAMYNDFDVSYQNFVAGKAAMIPNGYWMIDQIPEEMEESVRFSPFPGNKLISSPETFGWGVVSDYSEKVKNAATVFLKYRTAFNLEQKEALLRVDPQENSQLLNDYIKAYTENPQIVPNYQVKWNSILQEETLGEALPELVKEELTEEEFLKKADESIQQYEAER